MSENKNQSVLIVDDNVQYSQVLKMILGAGFGYQNVTTVDNLQEAYNLVSTEPERFNMLFVDFHFPDGESGGDFLQRLQTNKLLGNKVAFLVTAEPTVDNQRQAQQAGAKGVIAKPFDRKHLKEQLEKVEREKQLNEADGF